MITPIDKWEHIFLDTSVIFDLFANPEKLNNNLPVKERVLNTQKLFDYLNEVSNQTGKKYMFYVSSVTIAEMTRKDGADLLNAMYSFFNSSGLTFVDFSKNIACKISQNVKEYIADYSINQFISYIQKNTIEPGDVIISREWIIDDLKIVATAKSIGKIDVVLTADKKSFKPIAEKVNLPVLETNNLPKDLFDEISANVSIF